MEIYFNELSVIPTSDSTDASRNKIIELINVMKQLKKYDIDILRTYEGFYATDLGSNYTFSSFITDNEVSIEYRILLKSIIANPCIKDIESEEGEIFLNTIYKTNNHLGNEVSTEGIAVSYINGVPTLSLIDFPYWQNSNLPLKIYEPNNLIIDNIINISSIQSLQNNELIEWIKSITTEIELKDYQSIIKLFPLDKYDFDNRAIEDIMFWFYDDKRYLVRIKELLEDIDLNPFLGGKGRTENLGGGRASKRIVKKDRVVYTYTDNKIFIHQCKGHYNDN